MRHLWEQRSFKNRLYTWLISAFLLMSTCGSLRSLVFAQAAESVEQETISPQLSFVYAADIFGNTVSGYVMDSSTGAVKEVPGSPFQAGVQPETVAVHPSNRFVYAVNDS